MNNEDPLINKKFRRINKLDDSFLRHDSTFQIDTFMLKKLKLKGNELLLFAFIYSQKEHRCSYSTYKLAFILNLHNRSVQKNMMDLISRGLITKVEYMQKQVCKREYIANKVI